MLDEIVEVLRPGGVFLAADGDMRIWDENQQLVTDTAEGEPVSDSQRLDERWTTQEHAVFLGL